MFALYHEELLMGVFSLKKKKENCFYQMFLTVGWTWYVTLLCHLSLSSCHLQNIFKNGVSLTWCSPLFSSFWYCCLLQNVRSGLRISKIWCYYPIVFFFFFLMIVSNSQFFLIAINHSCLPLKEKFKIPLPSHDFCPFSNSVTALLYHW